MAMISLLPIVALVSAATGGSAAQAADVPADALIRLQRTSCPGCSAYSVSVDARGTVRYEGNGNVRVVGRRSAPVTLDAVAALLARAEQIRFFALRDAYTEIKSPDGRAWVVVDLPTTIITITANGRTKRVVSYIGAPGSISELAAAIDEVAGTKRWTFLDEQALTALLRSGWRVESDEGADFLREAIRRDDLPIARMLIRAGAHVNGPADRRAPPLGGARSVAMVDLLIRAGANVNERRALTDRTALMATDYKDAVVADALLKAGARLEDEQNGLTALGYAACAGNWRVVTVLLNAGAHPRGGSNNVSAVECARRGRQDAMNRRNRPAVLNQGVPSVQDFDRVVALLERAEARRKRR